MLWDIFCRVIDNYGDIGVAWRLSADLARRGHAVRLWVDDSSALQWMAPGACEGHCQGIQVMPWPEDAQAAGLASLPLADVWIETFGCDIAPEFVAHFAQRLDARAQPPAWINLEYLSAEDYVERSHGLPSPVLQGPARGWSKTFFYPGFTARTGGLLREASVNRADTAHRSLGLLQRLGLTPPSTPSTPAQPEAQPLRISLFCYEPVLLAHLLNQLARGSAAMQLLVTHGRATQAVRQLVGEQCHRGALELRYLPALTQQEYDLVLAACAINFVRGEDSVVRALWAGKPFVWHIYPQQDMAHAEKLQAFLRRLQFGQGVCQLHLEWNGLAAPPAAAHDWLPLDAGPLKDWQQQVESARTAQWKLPDLTSGLERLALKSR